MPAQLDTTGLTDEQIKQLQTIIEAFQAKNTLDTAQKSQIESKLNTHAFSDEDNILEELMKNPVSIEGLRFLTREEARQR